VIVSLCESAKFRRKSGDLPVPYSDEILPMSKFLLMRTLSMAVIENGAFVTDVSIPSSSSTSTPAVSSMVLCEHRHPNMEHKNHL
jgi:hypothetical protein